MRVDPYRVPDEPFGVFEAPLLELNEAQQIKRLKIPRGSLQDGAVKSRGLGEIAGLMLAQRTREQSIVHDAVSPTAKLRGASPLAVRSRIVAKADSRLRVKRAVSKSGALPR